MVKLLATFALLFACGSNESSSAGNAYPFTGEYSLQAQTVLISKGDDEVSYKTTSRGCHSRADVEVCVRAAGKEFLVLYRDGGSDEDARLLLGEARYRDENGSYHPVSDYPPKDPSAEYEIFPRGKPGRTFLIPAEKRHWERGPDGYDYPLLDWILPWDQRSRTKEEIEAELRELADQKRTVALEIPVATGSERVVYRFEFLLIRESLADYQRRIAIEGPN